MALPETILLLVLFERKISGEQIEEIFAGIRDAYQYAKIFEDRNMYAMRVPVDQIQGWRQAFDLLPEVIWTEIAHSA